MPRRENRYSPRLIKQGENEVFSRKDQFSTAPHNRHFILRGLYISNEYGATIVEFAFVVFIVFAIIGAVIDFGIGIFRFNLITHAVQDGARAASKYAVVAPDCNSVLDRAINEAYQATVNTSNITFEAEIQGGRLTLIARRPIECFFICQYLPNNIDLTTQSDVDLEHDGRLSANPTCQRTRVY